jgi:hypothetical protein
MSQGAKWHLLVRKAGDSVVHKANVVPSTMTTITIMIIKNTTTLRPMKKKIRLWQETEQRPLINRPKPRKR